MTIQELIDKLQEQPDKTCQVGYAVRRFFAKEGEDKWNVHVYNSMSVEYPNGKPLLIFFTDTETE